MFTTGQRTGDCVLGTLRITILDVCQAEVFELQLKSSVIYSLHICHFLQNIQKANSQLSARSLFSFLSAKIKTQQKIENLSKHRAVLQQENCEWLGYSPCALTKVVDSRTTSEESSPLTAMLCVCVRQPISIRSASLSKSSTYTVCFHTFPGG